MSNSHGAGHTLGASHASATTRRPDRPKVRPLHDRVLVRQVTPNRQTPGGLYVPDVHVEWPTVAVVIAIGPGKKISAGKREPAPEFRVGDTIRFKRRADSDVAYALDPHKLPNGDEERELLIRFEDVLAVVDPSEVA